jgi:Sulfotransferase family
VKALPTFFIIGAAKAGTTSLHYYLDQHPEVQMSAVKEPHFFAGPENGVPFPPERVESLEEYERLFDPSFEVRGEASPSYTNAPRRQGVPERIKELVPEAKFVYLVRDPIERTVSHYRHAVAAGKERRPLGEALAEVSDPYSYLACHSLYGRQLELYLRQFPAERVMVVDQAELLSDREATLRQVFAFLRVEESFTSERFEDELWTTGERRVSPPGQATFIARAIAPRTRWIPPGLRKHARRAYERAFWSPLRTEALDAEGRARLDELYSDDVARLRALTGKSFPSWSV